MRAIISISLAAIALVATATVGRAEDNAPTCGAFELIGTKKVFEVVDNPPEGESAGDRRVGYRLLTTDGVEKVGEVHFVSIVTRTANEDGGDVLIGKYMILLPGGWIDSDSIYELPHADDASQKAGNATLVVTGGVGAYANARGTIEIVAGDNPRYVFDLACD